MIKVVNILLVSILLASCSLGRQGQQLKVVAPHREKIFQLVEKIKFPQAVELGKGGDQRLEIRPGQWVSFISSAKDRSENLVLTTIKILSIQGNEVTIETESYSAFDGNKTVIQKVIAGFPVKNDVLFTNVKFDENLLKMKILRAYMQIGDGPAQELPLNELDSAGFNRALFSSLGQQGKIEEEAACQTAYLISHFCKKIKYSMKINEQTTQGITWGHSLVPIVGYVKMESDHQKTEVIAFGLTGATSSMHR